MKRKYGLAALLLAVGISLCACVPLPDGVAPAGRESGESSRQEAPQERRIVFPLESASSPSTSAACESSSYSSPPQQAPEPESEPEPEPESTPEAAAQEAGLVVNDEIVLLAGATNAQIKAWNGEAARVGYLYGGLPYVSHRDDTAALYPYRFMLQIKSLDMEAAMALDQEERDNFDREHNFFRDDYYVMGLEIFDTPEDLFIGNAPLSYDTVCEAFAQYPTLEFGEAGYTDAEYTRTTDLYYAVYTYSTGGSDFYIKFAFEQYGSEYLVDWVGIVMHEHEDLLRIMF